MATRLGPSGYPVAAGAASQDVSIDAVAATAEVADANAKIEITLNEAVASGEVAALTDSPSVSFTAVHATTAIAVVNAKIEIALSGVEATGVAGTLSVSSEQQSITLSAVQADTAVVNFGNTIIVQSSNKGNGKGRGNPNRSSGNLNIILDDPYAVPIGSAEAFGVVISSLTSVSITPAAAVGGAAAFALDLQVDENPDAVGVEATGTVAAITPEVGPSLVADTGTGDIADFALEISPDVALTAVFATGDAGTFAANIADGTNVDASLPIVAAIASADSLSLLFEVQVDQSAVQGQAGTAEADDIIAAMDLEIGEAIGTAAADVFSISADNTTDLTAAVGIGDALEFERGSPSPPVYAVSVNTAIGALSYDIKLSSAFTSNRYILVSTEDRNIAIAAVIDSITAAAETRSAVLAVESRDLEVASESRLVAVAAEVDTIEASD